MIARKTQKIIYNIVIICLLIGGVTYVCSLVITLETLNILIMRRMRSTYHANQHSCSGVHQKNLFRRVSTSTQRRHAPYHRRY